MARKPAAVIPELAFSANWVDAPADGPAPEFDATYCQLQIRAHDRVVTRYRTDDGQSGEAVLVPAYPTAEWVVTNWWALFYEPEKGENGSAAFSEVGYRFRHWLGAARDGFALPDLWITPRGDNVQIDSFATYLKTSRVSFTQSAELHLSVADAKDQAATFIRQVIARLQAKQIQNTALQEIWKHIENTDPESEQYCKLVGMLGLSPYDHLGDVEVALDALTGVLPMGIIEDLCAAATPDEFPALSNFVANAFSVLRESGQDIDMQYLPDQPAYRTGAPWKWGKAVADDLRKTFGALPSDAGGSAKVFSSLGIDPDRIAAFQDTVQTESIDGAIELHDKKARMAILHRKDRGSRRFAAGRALFMAWGATPHKNARLLTHAKTREQQASRAFAAELIAPIEFLRKALGRGPVSGNRIANIAATLEAPEQVVRYQAINHGIALVV